ncbi:MAG: FAD:protein FMN transferase [Candidatus Diapherotrites archaeon]|nr:FAD:protein FMN transferase [Candidatus Diapherotrites archaeon]
MAKGHITDKIAEFIDGFRVEDFFIDSKGDLLIFGEHEEEVFIQYSRDKEKQLFSIILKNSRVATSGDYNQYFGSHKKSHIVGPFFIFPKG